MIYALLAAFMAGIISGASGMRHWDNAEIQRYESAIESQKQQASATLAAETGKVRAATASAIELNRILDNENTSNDKTIDDLHTQLVKRVFVDPGKRGRGCKGAVSGNNSTRNPEADAATSELSAELAGFLKQQAFDADKAAQYAAECRRWAIANNCGVKADADR